MIAIDLSEPASPAAREALPADTGEGAPALLLSRSAAWNLYTSLSRLFAQPRAAAPPGDAAPYTPQFRDRGGTPVWIPLCPDHGQRRLRRGDDGAWLCHERRCGRRFNQERELERGIPRRCECLRVYPDRRRRSLEEKCPECGDPIALHQQDGCPVFRDLPEPMPAAA